MKPLCEWVPLLDASDNIVEWNLMVRLPNRPARSAATVWMNGTWSTWDSDGVGGENSMEPDIQRARVEAAASAIAQGFI